jgi:RNA polymerase sigma-70 factor, ECF subfamily
MDAPAKSALKEDLAALMARIAARDRAAFAQLYRLTHAKLYGVVIRIVARRDLAGEVLQEAFVRIWEKADDFDPVKGSPLAWMTAIARNRALDEMRRARPLAMEDLGERFDPPGEEIDPLASRERSEQLEALMKCLAALDAEKRKIVLLAYYRGASRETLAKKFNRPVPTIKTWLRRSLSELRDCLSS